VARAGDGPSGANYDPELFVAGSAVIKEVRLLRLAEEGAKEAFEHVVQQKRDLEAECQRLRGLLNSAYDTIRRQTQHTNVCAP